MPTPPLRFTFVLARYGENILGGAEKHARDIAEELAARGHGVRVLTTCAESYVDWENRRPEGSEWLNGVEVIRYRVRRGRMRPLDEITKLLASTFRASRGLGWAWAHAQGPTVPELVDGLEREAERCDVFVFFSLLSLLTFSGLRQVGDKSALIPLVHEEPPIYARLSRETLALPRAVFANTEEEAARIERVRGKAPNSPLAIVALGLTEPMAKDDHFQRPTEAPYLLILGRAGKTRPMLALWRELQAIRDLPPLELEDGSSVPWQDVKLVTVGEVSSMYQGLPNIVQLPFVDENTRWQLVRNAVALVNPSLFESLSLVLLEAWACGIPVVVNRRCDVTVGQSLRSGGGVAIDFDEPALGANELARRLASWGERERMAKGGEAYARERYRWDRVLEAYEAAARALRDGENMAEALEPWAF